MKQEKPNLRLYKLFKNKESVDNILEVYKVFKGKENLKYRLLLKALVYSTVYCESPQSYLDKDSYFSKLSFPPKYLLDVWRRWDKGRGVCQTAFGFKIDKIFGKMI